jgi:hypothetical protein
MRSLLLIIGLLTVPIAATSLAGGQEPLHNQSSGESDYFTYLPVVFMPAMSPPYDMTRFMIGDGRLYEVIHSGGSQARHQTQVEAGRFYQTKGNEWGAEWEQLWATASFIYRGTDTSPGNNQYYTLYENNVAGSAWSPRFWNVGDLFERNPYVVFYDKSNCEIVVSGFQRSWLRFEAFYPTYTFQSGIRLNNVIELSWLEPDGDLIESYFYAEFHGLVGWGSVDRGYSYVSELHGPGERPDNNREVIPCLASGPLQLTSELNFGPLPPGYRAK